MVTFTTELNAWRAELLPELRYRGRVEGGAQLPTEPNPYRAPESRSRSGAPIQGSYADAATRARITSALLGASLAVAWLMRAFEVALIDDFENGSVSHGVHAIYDLLPPLERILRVAGIVAYLFWVYRISSNARALGGRLSISPGWAVGYQVIPIVNLWMPFSIMKEIAQTSSADLRTVQRWWGALIATLASVVFTTAVVGHGTRASVVRLTVGVALLSVTLYFLHAMMNELGSKQRAHAERGRLPPPRVDDDE